MLVAGEVAALVVLRKKKYLQQQFQFQSARSHTTHTDRLVGLVVKASVSKAGGPGFVSR